MGSIGSGGPPEEVVPSLDQLSVAVVAIAGPRHQVVSCNAAARALLGPGLKNGARLADIWPASDREFFELIERVRVRGHTVEPVNRDLPFRGERRDYIWQIAPLREDARDGTVLIQGITAPDPNAAARSADRNLRLIQTISANATLGLFLMDSRQHCTFMNPAAERLTGFHLDEVQGRPLHDVIHYLHPDGTPYPLADCPIDRALPTRNQERGEEVFVHRDGHFYPVAFTASPIVEHGVPVGTVIEVEDISERRRREEAARFLSDASAVLGSSLDYEATLTNLARLAVPRLADWCSVDMLREDGSIARLAVAARDPATEAAIWHLREHFPFDPEAPSGVPAVIRTGRPELVPAVTEAALAASAENEEHLRLLLALRMQAYLRVPIVARDRTLGAISLVWATPGHSYGADDLRVAEELARRAGFAVDNARLYRDAQAAIAVRDQFLSIAAHELRTPLTPLTAGLQLLRRRIARGDRLESLDRLAETAERGIERLTRLVISLLDVSRIASGGLRLDRQPLDLAALVRRVVELQSATLVPRRRFELELEPEGMVVPADEERIEQVLVNLIENACKYSADDTPIRIRLWRDAADAYVSVADEGIGIPEDEHGVVFERFRRGSNVDLGRSGFGLGLAIVHEIVRAHDGAVTLESTPGVGSTFTVRLPFA
jgi:PAS domain S-box-containing protein